jgi:hypothetical protein
LRPDFGHGAACSLAPLFAIESGRFDLLRLTLGTLLLTLGAIRRTLLLHFRARRRTLGAAFLPLLAALVALLVALTLRW